MPIWRSRRTKSGKTVRYKFKAYRFMIDRKIPFVLPLNNPQSGAENAKIALDIYNSSNDPIKRRKIKRALVSAANYARWKGHEDVAEIYRRTYKQMNPHKFTRVLDSQPMGYRPTNWRIHMKRGRTARVYIDDRTGQSTVVWDNPARPR